MLRPAKRSGRQGIPVGMARIRADPGTVTPGGGAADHNGVRTLATTVRAVPRS
jgi:hypothetical protein